MHAQHCRSSSVVRPGMLMHTNAASKLSTSPSARMKRLLRVRYCQFRPESPGLAEIKSFANRTSVGLASDVSHSTDSHFRRSCTWRLPYRRRSHGTMVPGQLVGCLKRGKPSRNGPTVNPHCRLLSFSSMSVAFENLILAR